MPGCRHGPSEIAVPSDDTHSSADTRLATYGTLAPGRVNHGQLADLPRTWHDGWVMGHLQEAGWGAALGYPGLILDPNGDRVGLFLFESEGLPAHWDRLDAFEGDGYARKIVEVQTANGVKPAWIYALAD